MGCWGITALESDAGLDAVGLIRDNLPKDGKLELGKIIEGLKKDIWNAPPDVREGVKHTSPMALAEIIVKFLNGEAEELDYDDEWAIDDNKFHLINSFIASKESISWLRNYLSDTLQHAIENEKYWKWGGWFEEKNWIGWQKHMALLVSRLDEILSVSEDSVELISLKMQENSPIMGPAVEG
ncbi:DUF4259 domain-containing protein [Hungatella effluvii]|uniref:DUF4259 domain-containing protein n=1 Tax=Hungatella effluvii TaxID=1096246 RepID=UPI0022E47E93|nr:DUF4259 domain-containing protein [Hungatella effluvii]